MDFIFTDEQGALREITRAALEGHGGLAPARRIADNPGAQLETRHALRQLAAELGWLGLGVADENGGSGGTVVEQVLVASELGRVASPFSLADAAMAGRCLSAGADQRLAGVPDGTQICSWALADLSGTWTEIGVEATAAGDGWLLTGERFYLDAASDATDLIVPARHTDGTTALFCVTLPHDTTVVHPQETLDLTRNLCRVRLDQAPVGQADQVGTAHTAELLEDVIRIGTLLTAAESLGAAEMLLEMTVAHLQDRVQFGRTLASFQALKHRCADLKIALETTRTLVLLAAMHQRDATPQAPKVVSMAKARSARACVEIAGEALQLHGGIGMTWEHDLHLLLRRIRVNALMFGSLNDHRRLVLVEATCGARAHAS